MPRAENPERGAYSAWKRFLDDGTVPQDQVPEAIARSWKRCSDITLPTTGQAEPVSRSLLVDRVRANERLKFVVQPEFDALAEEIEIGRCVILLSDSKGLILDSLGSLDFARKVERVALMPGVQWSESGCGTNAIGTALAEREAIEVRGAQHYLPKNHFLYCAAAPIYTPEGEILGVLDISGDARDQHLRTMGLVRWAVQMIERRYALELKQDQELIRFHANPDLVSSHREGLIILEDGRIAGANPTAVKILKSSWQKILGAEIGAVFSGGSSHHDSISMVKSADGLVFYSRHERRKGSLRRIEPPPSHLPQQSSLASEGDPFYHPLLDRAHRMLDVGLSVLILGETGVGKEYFARRLYALSNRHKGPFVEVNCGALPESLIDSELFGYEEGAFTGARRRGMRGQIREADGGILFLDEIGDLPLSLQARLLRVLQERKIRPLGGRPTPVDFALVCATHRDLHSMVAAATFRADLYYRLQDYCVRLPALRERPDRTALINSLFSTLGGTALQLTLDEKAVDVLVCYQWPGNIRELISTLRAMIALAEPKSRLGIAELPFHIRGAQNLASATETMPATLSISREAIAEALKITNGNVSKAAKRLGVHRSTLYRRIPAS